MKFLSILTISIFLFTSCITEKEANTDDYSKAIDQLYRQFSTAYQTKNVNLVSNLYAEDAHYIPGSAQLPVLEGKEAIRNTFASYFEQTEARGRDLDISFRIINRQIGDSLAYDVGYYLIRGKEEGVPEFPEGGNVGKFTTVIKLQHDGSWKFLLDGFSPAPFQAFLSDSTAHNPLANS